MAESEFEEDVPIRSYFGIRRTTLKSQQYSTGPRGPGTEPMKLRKTRCLAHQNAPASQQRRLSPAFFTRPFLPRPNQKILNHREHGGAQRRSPHRLCEPLCPLWFKKRTRKPIETRGRRFFIKYCYQESDPMKTNEITGQVVDAAMKVHTVLGPGRWKMIIEYERKHAGQPPSQ